MFKATDPYTEIYSEFKETWDDLQSQLEDRSDEFEELLNIQEKTILEMKNATYYLHLSIKNRILIPSLITPIIDIIPQIDLTDGIQVNLDTIALLETLSLWFQNVHYVSAFYRFSSNQFCIYYGDIIKALS